MSAHAPTPFVWALTKEGRLGTQWFEMEDRQYVFGSDPTRSEITISRPNCDPEACVVTCNSSSTYVEVVSVSDVIELEYPDMAVPVPRHAIPACSRVLLYHGARLWVAGRGFQFTFPGAWRRAETDAEIYLQAQSFMSTVAAEHGQPAPQLLQQYTASRDAMAQREVLDVEGREASRSAPTAPATALTAGQRQQSAPGSNVASSAPGAGALSAVSGVTHVGQLHASGDNQVVDTEASARGVASEVQEQQPRSSFRSPSGDGATQQWQRQHQQQANGAIDPEAVTPAQTASSAALLKSSNNNISIPSPATVTEASQRSLSSSKKHTMISPVPGSAAGAPVSSSASKRVSQSGGGVKRQRKNSKSFNGDDDVPDEEIIKRSRSVQNSLAAGVDQTPQFPVTNRRKSPPRAPAKRIDRSTASESGTGRSRSISTTVLSNNAKRGSNPPSKMVTRHQKGPTAAGNSRSSSRFAAEPSSASGKSSSTEYLLSGAQRKRGAGKGKGKTTSSAVAAAAASDLARDDAEISSSLSYAIATGAADRNMINRNSALVKFLDERSVGLPQATPKRSKRVRRSRDYLRPGSVGKGGNYRSRLDDAPDAPESYEPAPLDVGAVVNALYELMSFNKTERVERLALAERIMIDHPEMAGDISKGPLFRERLDNFLESHSDKFQKYEVKHSVYWQIHPTLFERLQEDRFPLNNTGCDSHSLVHEDQRVEPSEAQDQEVFESISLSKQQQQPPPPQTSGGNAAGGKQSARGKAARPAKKETRGRPKGKRASSSFGAIASSSNKKSSFALAVQQVTYSRGKRAASGKGKGGGNSSLSGPPNKKAKTSHGKNGSKSANSLSNAPVTSKTKRLSPSKAAAAAAAPRPPVVGTGADESESIIEVDPLRERKHKQRLKTHGMIHLTQQGRMEEEEEQSRQESLQKSGKSGAAVSHSAASALVAANATAMSISNKKLQGDDVIMRPSIKGGPQIVAPMSGGQPLIRSSSAAVSSLAHRVASWLPNPDIMANSNTINTFAKSFTRDGGPGNIMLPPLLKQQK